jgi:hypothetical protein
VADSPADSPEDSLRFAGVRVEESINRTRTDDGLFNRLSECPTMCPSKCPT